MNKTNSCRVALIFGGAGYEHDISVMGARDTEVLLLKSGISIFPIIIKKDGGWYSAKKARATVAELADESMPLSPVFPIRLGEKRGFFKDGEIIAVDTALPLLHGDFGEDGKIQGALASADIPYIGCETISGAVCADKAYTKIIASSLGIPTVKGIFITKEATSSALVRAEAELKYPMFIKPTRLGSSVGAETASCREELLSALEKARALGSGFAIVEEFIGGARELECAFFELDGKQYFTNIGEIGCEHGFYDYDNKYSDRTCAKITSSASIPEELAERIKDYSRKIVSALGCRDLARIDFFLSKSGELYFNEINTMPGMTGVSMFPRLLADYGIPPNELLSKLAFQSAARR